MVSDERPSTKGPATFREVFAEHEYRAVFAASTLTWVGDYVAKAAVTLLVYRETESVALSAAAFAVSYLPWLVGGPLLATLAERHRFRRVMVACDLIRMALMLLVAIPGMPVPVILALLFATTLANSPSQAARSALLPLILPGDRLVVGLSINASVGQAAQVVGYLLGAAIATVSPTAALLMNASAFALSAALVRFGVRDRPPAMNNTHRSHLLRETAEGFGMVFGTPMLRAIAVLVFSAMLFSIVPEGLAAAWANEHAGENVDPGLSQAVIMAATPAGFILGGLVIGRTVAPARRLLLLRPLAVAAPLALVPALLDPPPVVVALLAGVCGFAVAGLLPTANGLFVQSLPDGFRARAFGVMATGMQVIQGAAVLVTGLLAERFPIPLVVGVWSAAGVVLMSLVILRWPDQQTVAASVEAAQTASAAAAGTVAPDEPSEQDTSDHHGPDQVDPDRPRHAVT
ncbi:MFS transporter [Micromonospora sp. HNM0581]|uniref:MFS transporter n=1 Tax=Micromonospora sp. HNM0581 TaxID=2716341 RepID=UPI00146D2FD9|nr:MFS transporter [Micromonospora sp. HNM0581]NLU80818.1 MFS transporter [Micromonospora sp. HNM0581]